MQASCPLSQFVFSGLLSKKKTYCSRFEAEHMVTKSVTWLCFTHMQGKTANNFIEI